MKLLVLFFPSIFLLVSKPIHIETQNIYIQLSEEEEVFEEQKKKNEREIIEFEKFQCDSIAWDKSLWVQLTMKLKRRRTTFFLLKKLRKRLGNTFWGKKVSENEL